MKAIIGAKYTAEATELKEYFDEIITFSPNPLLADEINNHADIHFFNCKNGNIIGDTTSIGETEAHLKGYNLVRCHGIKSPYPDDIKLNALLLGDTLLCNKKYVADEIIYFCNNNNINIVHTNQGYAKCSVCVVNDNAVITEDPAIAYLLKNCQIDVLLIEKGYVKLTAEHYGFIGGASGKINEALIYFSGDISNHPDYDRISAFLNKYNVKAIYNKNRQLYDFGGFITI